MAHHLGSASGRLLLRDRERIRRVEHRHLRHEQGRGGSPLLVFAQIGNNGKRVHLGARSRKREHRIHRQRGLDFRAIEHQVPRVAVVFRSTRDNLGRIDNRTAAHSEHHVDRVLLAQARALANRLDARVRLNARKLHHMQTRISENRRGLVIQAALLNGAAAIDEQHIRAAFRKFAQMRDLAFAEMNPCGNAEREIIHVNTPFECPSIESGP